VGGSEEGGGVRLGYGGVEARFLAFLVYVKSYPFEKVTVLRYKYGIKLSTRKAPLFAKFAEEGR